MPDKSWSKCLCKITDRYLASGADDSSVWLEALRIEGDDVICRAANATELNGLLTVRKLSGPIQCKDACYELCCV